MRLRSVLFLLASTVHIVITLNGASVTGEGMMKAVKMKALEQSVATPLELFWKDLWDLTFHRQGNKLWKKLYFMLGRAGKYKFCRSVSLVTMWELKRSLFSPNEHYNTRAWSKITTEFEKHFREWWSQNPLDPMSALDIGIWKCLVKMYTGVLEPHMRGSQKLATLEGIIFDPKLKMIKEWSDAAHIKIIMQSGSYEIKYQALARLAKVREQRAYEERERSSSAES